MALADPLALAMDGFLATLLAASLIYTRKTLKSVKGVTERPWIMIFASNATFLLGSIVQFYSDLQGGLGVSPFLISAIPASTLMVVSLVYGYRYVIGNNLLIEHLSEVLRKHLFSVKRDAKLTGRSGAQHFFDILATRDSIVVAMDVMTSFFDVGEIPVLRIFMKALDTRVTQPVLVAMQSLTRMARKFATEYRLTLVEGRTVDAVVRELDEFLGNIRPREGPEAVEEFENPYEQGRDAR